MGITTGLIVNKKGQIVKKFYCHFSNGTPIIKAVLLEEAAK